MIDWIDERCKVWGRQKWAILRGRQLRKNEEPKDGPPFAGPAAGISARLIEEGAVGAAITTAKVKDPREVLTPEALQVSVAIQLAIKAQKLSALQHDTLIAHYIVRARIDTKLKALSIGRDAYYDRIHRAHKNIEPFLDDTHTVDVDEVRCG